jgi:hypothetical protein
MTRTTDDEDTTKHEFVEKFILTFRNGDYDVELDNALSYDRGVTLPVRPTQASYNKPDNWIERNRNGLEKMKGRLQSCIYAAMNKNGLKLSLTHSSDEDQLLDNEEPIVWYEPILDEYWDQLDAKIKQLEDICDIHIENVEIRKEHLALLVTAPSGKVSTIEYIRFINVNLCREGIIWLSKLVDVSVHHFLANGTWSFTCPQTRFF